MCDGRLDTSACGIISSCISTFYRFCCRLGVKQVHLWGLGLPLGCLQLQTSVDIFSADAPVTRADPTIYHDRELSCKAVQSFRRRCDVDLRQRTLAVSCWSYAPSLQVVKPKTGSERHSLTALVRSSFWICGHTRHSFPPSYSAPAFVFNWIIIFF